MWVRTTMTRHAAPSNWRNDPSDLMLENTVSDQTRRTATGTNAISALRSVPFTDSSY